MHTYIIYKLQQIQIQIPYYLPHSTYPLTAHWKCFSELKKKKKFVNPVFSKLSQASSAVPSPHLPVSCLLSINPSPHTPALSSVCCFLTGPQTSEVQPQSRKLRWGEAKVTEGQSIKSGIQMLAVFYPQDSLSEEWRQ